MKIKYFFAGQFNTALLAGGGLFAALICTVFIACDNVNNAVPRITNENHSTYTVLYYNATLNQDDTELMLPYLLEVLDVGASDTVKFAAQINAQFDIQNEANNWSWAGTRETKRFWAKNGKSDNFEFENPGKLLKLDEPNTIADFIRWGTGKFPADKYILVMMGHGAVWDPAYDKNDGWAAPSNEPVSYMLQPDSSRSGGIRIRASVFDNSFGTPGDEPGISSFALAEGIKRSGKKIDMVYQHSCVQNMLENLCELQVTGLVDYVLAAGHYTYSVAGDYGSLLNFLNTGADLEEVISQYCYYNVRHMEAETVQSELIFTDLRKLDPVLAAIKKIVGLFNTIPNINTLVTTLPVKTDSETSGVYFYDAMVNPLTGIPEINPANWKSADINSYIQYMNSFLNADAVLQTKKPLSALSTDLLKAINAAIVWGEDTSSIPILTTFGVTVMPSGKWTSDYAKYYTETAFDKATGWSTWLSSAKNVAVNKINPPWDFSGKVMYESTQKVLVVEDTNIAAASTVDATKLKVGSIDLAYATHIDKVNVFNGSVQIGLNSTGVTALEAGGAIIGKTFTIDPGFVTTKKRPNAAATGIIADYSY